MAVDKGSNGQQKGSENVIAFKVWRSTQTEDDFRQITRGGQLNRTEIAKAIGCGRSAFTQNESLGRELNELEIRLRSQGILPPLVNGSASDLGQPKLYDNTRTGKLRDSMRVATVEAENIELKAKVCELEKKLERFGELSETLAEMGFMPR